MPPALQSSKHLLVKGLQRISQVGVKIVRKCDKCQKEQKNYDQDPYQSVS